MEIKAAVTRFAQQWIAPYRNLHDEPAFPSELWSAMSEAKLFGLGLPETFGGWAGDDAAKLVDAGRAMVETGGNMGIGLAWLIHVMTARYLVDRFGTAQQKDCYLKDLAEGRKTACFAVSEPGVGPHPKHLKTMASLDNGTYRISGRKTYLTNGPMADLFIVIAVTHIDNGHKHYTAFILENETAGLEIEEPLALSYLNPAGHCSISLSGCPVSPEQILGPKDEAYEKMVLPFRHREDILISGLLFGGVGYLLRWLTSTCRKSSANRRDGIGREIIKLKSSLEAMHIVAQRAVRGIETTGTQSITQDLLSLFIYDEIRRAIDGIKRLAEEYGLNDQPPFRNMTMDLTAMQNIGEPGMKAGRKRLVDKLLAD